MEPGKLVIFLLQNNYDILLIVSKNTDNYNNKQFFLSLKKRVANEALKIQIVNYLDFFFLCEQGHSFY